MQQIPMSTKHDAIVLESMGHTQESVAQTLGVSVRTVQRAKHKFLMHGDVEGGAGKRGPKGKLDRMMEEVKFSPIND